MFTISSPEFVHEGAIPRRHTCEGSDRSPPLEWRDPPAGTRSFVLIVDDPDAPDPAAPTRIWLHWARYNIPAQARTLADGAGSHPPSHGAELLTDAGTRGYHGPCPPIGTHRYFFRLIALDIDQVSLPADATRADLERAIAPHVLGTAILMGTYRRDDGR